MGNILIDVGGWTFAIVFAIFWFWKGMEAAMWFHIAAIAIVVAIVFMGGPQFISGIITGVAANEISRRLLKNSTKEVALN